MSKAVSLTFEEGCNKYLENFRQRNLREGTIGHYKQSYTQFYKYFDSNMPTIIPISSTNKENLAIWENKMGISRAIEYMIEIGLLGIENNKYQFGAYYEKDNKSKSYYYYKEKEIFGESIDFFFY